MNWYDLVPYDIAKQQIAWEKGQRIAYAIRQGAKLREVTVRLKTIRQYASWSAIRYAERRSPVEEWLEETEWLEVLKKKLERLEVLKKKSEWHENHPNRRGYSR